MAASGKNISTINILRAVPGTVFGDVWWQAGGEFPARVQKDYQLVIVHLGEARVNVDGDLRVVPPGSVTLLSPGHRERFRFSRAHRTHHTWCAVHPSIVPAALRRRLVKLSAVQGQSETFECLMKAAFAVTAWRRPEGQAMLRQLGLTLLEEYIRMARSAGEPARESPWDRARVYLEEHCVEEDCLAGAARTAGVTPQHLIRVFRQRYDVTPGRYLWQVRVERGAGLLTATGLTVAEIAERCGFKNPFHFSRLLKKMQGVSPRELRQRAG